MAPLQTDREIRAAAQVGFNVTHALHSVRVMGRDRPGIAAELTQKLAGAGIARFGVAHFVDETQKLLRHFDHACTDRNRVSGMQLG